MLQDAAKTPLLQRAQSRSRRDEGENAVTFDDVRKISPAARIG
jgi:hypothetical protein